MPQVCKHMHFKDVFDKMRKHDFFLFFIFFKKDSYSSFHERRSWMCFGLKGVSALSHLFLPARGKTNRAALGFLLLHGGATPGWTLNQPGEHGNLHRTELYFWLRPNPNASERKLRLLLSVSLPTNQNSAFYLA